MTVLVTGRSGLVVSRLPPRLVGAGVDCRALVRGEKKVPNGVAAAEGDLLDPASVTRAVEGVSAIIPLASVFRTPDADLIWRSNPDGTNNLIAATKTHAPEARFIMASTSNVYNIDGPHPGREGDAADPKQAHPSSKLAAENELRRSELNWSVQRFGFVYGDRDGHLKMLPKHAISAKWHPAQKMSMVHHRDIATAMSLALNGAMDGRIVNIADEAPTSLSELVTLLGETMGPSSEPLANPWRPHIDGSLARRLGFQPTVRTVYQAAQEGIL